MKLSRFHRLIETHGADPQRWPAELRADAVALVASSPEARALLATARSLDDALAGWQPAPPAIDAAGLAARLAEAPQDAKLRTAPDPGAAWSLTIGWQKMAGLATVGLAGLVVGWTGIATEMTGLPGFDDAFELGAAFLTMDGPLW